MKTEMIVWKPMDGNLVNDSRQFDLTTRNATEQDTNDKVPFINQRKKLKSILP